MDGLPPRRSRGWLPCALRADTTSALGASDAILVIASERHATWVAHWTGLDRRSEVRSELERRAFR